MVPMSEYSSLVPNEWLLYCRPGFEHDLVAELCAKLEAKGSDAVHSLEWQMDPLSGYVCASLPMGEPANVLHRALPLDHLIFARQTLVALPALTDLAPDDRIGPIVEQVIASGWSFESICSEQPDTNEGKALSGLGKALQRPLESVLRKRGAFKRRAGKRQLHLFWTAGNAVQLAMSFPGNRSEFPNGIRHLRFPHEAPSRSTLKLEEAWHEFLPRDRWEDALYDGAMAADLGAAPGGWTYQLVQKGMHVYAIDNGPMSPALMKTGQVEHLREDGFVWTPPISLLWLVCDIVDRPERVIRMIERWLLSHWCQFAVFNLKLPMNRRWEEVDQCLSGLEARLEAAGVRHVMRCRHLYHDREEVTVFVELLN